MTKQKSVLLLGSYGHSNLGDDLLMWNFLELLRERDFKEIYVNAGSTEFLPRPIKEHYPDLKLVDTYKTSVIDYIKLMRHVDVIVYGGGTLYKELYASTGRSKYSVIVRMMAFNLMAKILGTRLIHLNIGIGSLKTSVGRMISKLAITSASSSIFRDQKSYDYAKDVLRIPEKKIIKSTDGLFLNQVWEHPWKSANLRIDRKKYKNVVGVNVLSDIPDWVDRDTYVQTMKDFVSELLDRGNYVLFVPFQHAYNPRNDLLFTHEVFDEMLKGKSGYKILSEVPIDLASSYLRQCDVFVGMRFHSLLLAAVNQVPFVALAYDTKCWRFVQENDYPFAVELEKADSEVLIDLFEQTMASRQEASKKLGMISRRMYTEAQEELRKLHL